MWVLVREWVKLQTDLIFWAQTYSKTIKLFQFCAQEIVCCVWTLFCYGTKQTFSVLMSKAVKMTFYSATFTRLIINKTHWIIMFFSHFSTFECSKCLAIKVFRNYFHTKPFYGILSEASCQADLSRSVLWAFPQTKTLLNGPTVAFVRIKHS